MKILFLDVNQTETAEKITKINTFQQIAIANAYKDLGHDVYIGRFNLTDYSPIKNYDMNNSDDLNEFEIIFLSNYSLNFFGGEEIKSMTKSFKLLHNFNGRIIYLLSDFEMKLKQYKPRDEWVGPHDDEDYEIKNYEIAVHTFNKKLTEELLNHKVHYLPIQYSTFYKQRKDIYENYFKLTDLIYCGSYRSGRRENKMLHYFFDTEYSSTFVGNIKLSQFNYKGTNPPEFLGKVLMNEISEVQSQSLATIVIGDKSYNNHFYTTRILEAIRDGVVLFIDEEYDKNHLLGFKEFRYVKDKHELLRKINQIKESDKLLNQLLQEQEIYYINNTDEEFLNYCKEILKNEN